MVIALASLWLSSIWALAIPPLDAPDEPAHLQAVMEVRNKHILPETHFDPGNPAGEVIGAPGDPSVRAYTMSLSRTLPVDIPYSLIPYESTQPPLYYLVAGSVAQLVPANPQIVLYVSRLVAVVFGAGAVYFCYLATRQLAPSAPVWAAATAATVALLPQFCFNSATAANDSAANLACALAFYIWFRGLRDGNYDPSLWRAGAAVGLALLAKLTALALLPGLGLLLLLRLFQAGSAHTPPQLWWRRGLRQAVGASAGLLIVCGWWLVRNTITYGEPTGAAATLRFYMGKFPLFDLQRPETVRTLVQSTIESAWGRFGWMNLPLPAEWYLAASLAALVLVALTGLGALAALGGRLIRRSRVVPIAWQAVLISAVVLCALAAGYMQFNLTVALQPQARYFFAVLLPGALLLTGGLHGLARGRVFKVVALSVPLAGLSLMNLVALAVVIVDR